VEIAHKFLELSDGVVPASNAHRVIDEIGKFENCESIGKLLSLMAAV
jgi:hypothetical protein